MERSDISLVRLSTRYLTSRQEANISKTLARVKEKTSTSLKKTNLVFYDEDQFLRALQETIEITSVPGQFDPLRKTEWLMHSQQKLVVLHVNFFKDYGGSSGDYEKDTYYYFSVRSLHQILEIANLEAVIDLDLDCVQYVFEYDDDPWDMDGGEVNRTIAGGRISAKRDEHIDKVNIAISSFKIKEEHFSSQNTRYGYCQYLQNKDNCLEMAREIAIKTFADKDLIHIKSSMPTSRQYPESSTFEGQITTEKLANKDVVFELDIHETRPRGEQDTYRKVAIRASEVTQLPLLPIMSEYPSYVSSHLYWFAEAGQWIVFNRYFDMETAGSFDEDFQGPYLVESEPPPTAHEIYKANISGKKLERKKSFY